MGRYRQMSLENWKEIEINYCGKRFKGTYYVDDQRLVTVAAWNGTKTAKLGILPVNDWHICCYVIWRRNKRQNKPASDAPRRRNRISAIGQIPTNL